MKVLVDRNTKVVIDVVENATVTEVGINVGNCIYASGLQIDIYDLAAVPEEVKPQQYKYNEISGFTVNPSYTQPFDPMERIKQLEGNQALMQQAIDDLILGGAF